MSETQYDLVELEKKLVVISDYLARDLMELNLGHIEYSIHIESGPDGPEIAIKHNGSADEGESLNNLFYSLLREQEWPEV